MRSCEAPGSHKISIFYVHLGRPPEEPRRGRGPPFLTRLGAYRAPGRGERPQQCGGRGGHSRPSPSAHVRHTDSRLVPGCSKPASAGAPGPAVETSRPRCGSSIPPSGDGRQRPAPQLLTGQAKVRRDQLHVWDTVWMAKQFEQPRGQLQRIIVLCFTLFQCISTGRTEPHETAMLVGSYQPFPMVPSNAPIRVYRYVWI